MIIEMMLVMAGVLFGVMTVTYLVGIWVRNTGVVDVAWGLGIILVGAVVLGRYGENGVQAIFVGLIMVWGVRLSLFLFFTRVLRGELDERYTRLEQKWGKQKYINVLLNYYLQAVLQLLICVVMIPVFLYSELSFGIWQVVGVGLLGIAIVGEAVADLQLFQFKRSGKKGICMEGLWGYSRHPNYFFEVLIWVALAVYVTPLGWYWAWVSPLTVWIIVRYVTGPYTERVSVEKHGEEFLAYQSRVPMIVPRFCKK